MTEYADDFFVSLGLKPLTEAFWNLTVVEKKPGIPMLCNFLAHNEIGATENVA